MKDSQATHPKQQDSFCMLKKMALDLGPSPKAPGNTGSSKEPGKPHNPAQGYAQNGRHYCTNLRNLSLGLHRFSRRARKLCKKPLHRPTGSSLSLHCLTHRIGKLHNLEFKCSGSPICLAFTLSFGFKPNFLWKIAH